MISLIIPTLNEEKYIRKTLQCLQEFRKNKIIEIIIVDGLSQDNTLALSRDLCDKVISVKPGRADQLNAGALKANNNLLLFIKISSFKIYICVDHMFPNFISDLRINIIF